MSKTKKYLFAIFSLVLIYFKPYYGFLIVPLFYIEYMFFFDYFFIYLKNKKMNGYFIIKIDKIDVLDKSTFRLWIEISKLNSFIRLYSLLSKKKINFLIIVKTLFILSFQIPLKLILLLKKILSNNGSDFNEKMSFTYDSLFEDYKNLKIEFINGTIYLNCFLVRDLVKNVQHINPKLTLSDTKYALKTLRDLALHFKEIEKKDNERVSIYMAEITTKEGLKVPSIHPTYNFKADDYDFKSINAIKGFSLHATLNTNTQLTTSQITTVPLYRFIRETAKNPGCILSADSQATPSYVIASAKKLELEAIAKSAMPGIIENFDCEFELSRGGYLTEKEETFSKFIEHICSHNNVPSAMQVRMAKIFINNCVINNWNFALTYFSESAFFQEIINNFNKEL